MKNAIFILFIFIIVACGPPKVTSTSCPDGSRCMAIDCSSPNYSHSDCLVALGNACTAGYDMIEDRSGCYLIRCHDPKSKW